MSNLHQREADIAIRTHRPTQEDLVIRTLGSSTYRFYAHKDYLNNTMHQQWQLIEFQANARVLAWSQAFIKRHAYTIAFSTNDLYMACHATRQKIGFMLLPDFLARQYPELVAVDPMNRVPLTDLEIYSSADNYAAAEQLDTHSPIPLAQSYPLYLVMHPDVRRSARVRAVADWLIDCSTRLEGFA